jgi:hypothetical protein
LQLVHQVECVVQLGPKNGLCFFLLHFLGEENVSICNVYDSRNCQYQIITYSISLKKITLEIIDVISISKIKKVTKLTKLYLLTETQIECFRLKKMLICK